MTTEPTDLPASDPAPPEPLTYAPAPARRRRWRFLAWALLLAGAVLFAWRWHDAVFVHVRVLQWQRACATHTFAPDAEVARSSGPAGALARIVPGYWKLYVATAISKTTSMGPGGPGPAFAQTVAFLHHRRSPGGTERIVAVRCVPLYLTSASVVQAFWPLTVEPAAVWRISSRPILHEGPFAGGYPVRGAVVVYGGQPDPADPSHFTIAYTVDGRPGTIDGWLRDDGSVSLQVRPGSADVYPRPAGGVE